MLIGLDIIKFGRFLLENDIDFFAVSTYKDALCLRKNGFTNKILLVSPVIDEKIIKELILNNITLTISSKESGLIANKVANELETLANAHIKIDTGLGRYGFLYTDIDEIVNMVAELSNIKIEATFSHFSESFKDKSKQTSIQFERFMNCISKLKEKQVYTGFLHICNSSAFLKYPEYHLDAVRIGSAFLGKIAIPNIYGLRKIGYLETEVIEIKKLPKNSNIGYGNSFKTKKPITIAVIPMGYIDGYNVSKKTCVYRLIDNIRYLYNDMKHFIKPPKLNVLIGGKKYNLLGCVSMNSIVVDITDAYDIKVGDKAIINDINTIYINNQIEREYV